MHVWGPMRCSQIVSLTLAVGLAGCSSEPAPNGHDPPPAADVYALSEAALDDMGALVESRIREGATLEQALADAAELLRARDVVSAVELSTSGGRTNFVVTFVNGVHFVMPVRWFDALPAPSPTGARSGALSAGLPASKQALFVDTMEFPTQADLTGIIVDRHGYDVRAVTDPGVEDYVGIDAYDLVYIGTHGHYYELDGVPHYALATSTFRDSRYEGEDGLVGLPAGNGGTVVILRGFAGTKSGGAVVDPWTRYGVNEAFIRDHNGAFGDDAVVYVDACGSTQRPRPDVAPPLLGVLAEMNVRHYLGWDAPVRNGTAIAASNYLFTRLVGDVPAGLYETPEPAPPTRAFTLHEAFAGAEAEGKTVDSTGATLEYMDLTQGQRAALLVPIVDGVLADVDVMQQTESLEISGVFGDRPGKVKLCDTPPMGENLAGCTDLSVKSWADDEIVVDYSGEGDGAGHLVVAVDGRFGTFAPLTGWEGTLTVSGQLSAIGPNVNVDIDARFVAEIVDERPSPDATPEPAFAQSAGLFGLDSRAKYQLTGTFEDTAYRYTYTTNGETPPNVDGMPAFHGAVVLDPAEGKATFQVTLVVQAMVRRVDKQTALVETLPMPVAVPFVAEASLQPDGTIEGGSAPLGSLTVRWDTITPTAGPDDDTPR